MCCLRGRCGVLGNIDSAVSAFRNALRSEFGEDGFTGGGIAESILGLNVKYDDEELNCTISMPGYIAAVAERFGVNQRTTLPNSPLPLNHVDRKHEGAPLTEEKRLSLIHI